MSGVSVVGSTVARIPEVTLVTRSGCCLCEEAREVLERVREDRPFRLVVRDLDEDADLPRAWSDEVPVILLDGRKRFKIRVEERRLRRLLARASRSRSSWRPSGAAGDEERGSQE